MRAIAAAVAAAAVAHAAIVQSSGPHLFVDADGIAEASGLVFEQAVPSKNTDAPLVYPQYPWEVAVHFYTSLVTVPPNVNGLDAPSFQLYYVCAHQLLFNYSIQVRSSRPDTLRSMLRLARLLRALSTETARYLPLPTGLRGQLCRRPHLGEAPAAVLPIHI